MLSLSRSSSPLLSLPAFFLPLNTGVEALKKGLAAPTLTECAAWMRLSMDMTARLTTPSCSAEVGVAVGVVAMLELTVSCLFSLLLLPLTPSSSLWSSLSAARSIVRSASGSAASAPSLT